MNYWFSELIIEPIPLYRIVSNIRIRKLIGEIMTNITKEKNTKLLKFQKEMNESITLICCNNDNYNAKTINYDIMTTHWNDNHEIISFFNYDIENGFEDRVRPLYFDDEEAIIEVITYYFKED